MLSMYKNILALSLITCFSLALSACNFISSEPETNTAEHDGNNLAVKLALPRALTGIPISELQAQVSVDGDTPVPLTVNSDNTVTGELIGVEAGERQLTITYFVLESGVPVDIAEAVKTVNVIRDSTTQVNVSESDLNRNFDDDLDGYTNLAEIRIGTQALNASDSPAGESTVYVVSNGSFGQATSTSYIIKHTLGYPVNGSATSTNYVIEAGFSSF